MPCSCSSNQTGQERRDLAAQSSSEFSGAGPVEAKQNKTKELIEYNWGRLCAACKWRCSESLCWTIADSHIGVKQLYQREFYPIKILYWIGPVKAVRGRSQGGYCATHTNTPAAPWLSWVQLYYLPHGEWLQDEEFRAKERETVEKDNDRSIFR